MFKKVLGKVCKNPECELKDKIKEDFAVMCECGHALEDVTTTDNTKVAISVVILLLLIAGGAYFGMMKLKSKAEDIGGAAVKAGIEQVSGVVANPGAGGAAPAPPAATATPGSSPTDPKAAIGLVSDGLKLAKENNMQAALDKFKTATEKDPSNGQAFGNLGAVYIAMGKNSEAFEASSQAVKLDPDNPFWHLNIAEIYSMKNDKSNALRELEVVINGGFKDVAKLKSFNFKNIEKDPQYRELVRKIGG